MVSSEFAIQIYFFICFVLDTILLQNFARFVEIGCIWISPLHEGREKQNNWFDIICLCSRIVLLRLLILLDHKVLEDHIIDSIIP